MDFPISDMYPALAMSAVALAIVVWVWTRIPTHPHFNQARIAITAALVLVTATVAWTTCFGKHRHSTIAEKQTVRAAKSSWRPFAKTSHP